MTSSVSVFVFADVGWLTGRLLHVTLSSADWVLWLLLALSVLSLAVMFERAVYFRTRRLRNAEELASSLARGDLERARVLLEGQDALEACVLRAGLQAVPQGADAVEQALLSALTRERPRYERFLSFLGTLGSNAPFIGLFGTVLGIIKAFHDLGAVAIRGAAVQQTVMSGVSEALVATAVGLAVAIPAVVGFNVFTRALRNLTARTQSLGYALLATLRSASTGIATARPVRGVVEG
jgi:biopolymer transport protein ExbB